VSVPALVVTIAVESRPRIEFAACSEREEVLVLDWYARSNALLDTAGALLRLLAVLSEEESES
jgi:hypothetical protein